jgi:hypothetical protein
MPCADESSSRWRDFIPAGLLLCVGALVITLMAAWPSPDQQEVAVMLAPGDGLPQAEALASRIDAQLVDLGGLPNVFIFRSTHPGLVATLYRSGAWLVLNPLGARGCTSAVNPVKGQ